MEAIIAGIISGLFSLIAIWLHHYLWQGKTVQQHRKSELKKASTESTNRNNLSKKNLSLTNIDGKNHRIQIFYYFFVGIFAYISPGLILQIFLGFGDAAIFGATISWVIVSIILCLVFYGKKASPLLLSLVFSIAYSSAMFAIFEGSIRKDMAQ